MACACQKKKRKDIIYVRSLAIKAAKINHEDIQIYIENDPVVGEIYNFGFIDERIDTVVEYIRYADYIKN